MILIIDNYDSFTYNLYQVFLKLNYPIKVVRNDKITIDEIIKINPSHIVISPGPGTPHEAGISIETVQKLKGTYPILGVCLGHQAICAAFGVPIVSAGRIVHGKVEKLIHNGKGIFRNVDTDTAVTRYHSLAAKEKDIPDCFNITAKCEDGEVMAVEHKELHLVGVQFHPESIGTKEGEKMIKNFLNYRRENIDIKKHLTGLITGQHLSYQDSFDIMDEITEGNLNEAQIASLLTAVQIKGIHAEELAGFAAVLRQKAAPFPLPQPGERRLDNCGTGGAKEAKTFNVSTVVSLLAAACGAKIVKHGNKAATSKSGSADLFEKLGVNIEMDPITSYDVFKQIGITFCYARKFHPSMRFAAPVRASLGFKTLFNFIGPLSNPAHATHQIIGVSEASYTEKLCEALSILDVERAMIVHGLDGLDEISLCAPTRITELKKGWIRTYIFHPESLGLELARHEELTGGDVETNKAICLGILKGDPSRKADLVYMNTGAALYIYGLVDNIRDGYFIAREVAQSAKPMELLDQLAALSQGNKLVLQ